MKIPIRPNVQGMKPYSPGRPIGEIQRELGITDVIKLASNENPLGPSPKAIAAVKQAAETMHLYPDAGGYDLKQTIAEKFSLPTDQIVLGNGSDDLIAMIGLALLGNSSDEIIMGDPSFVRYEAAAELAPCRVIKVPVDSEFRLDIPMMKAAITPHTKIIFIANPNNPTGTMTTRAELDELLNGLPEGILVVLDEAYCEFAANNPDYPNSLEYLKRGDPVAGLRTMSKAYGLAGLRLGFAFAPAEIADAMNRVRQPFNANALAQAAASAALGDDEFIQRTVHHTENQLVKIMNAFRAIGAKPIPSHANFVLADLGRPAKPFTEALLRKGVIVRSGEVLGLPNTLRVSVGTDAETDRFCTALQTAAAELGVGAA